MHQHYTFPVDLAVTLTLSVSVQTRNLGSSAGYNDESI